MKNSHKEACLFASPQIKVGITDRIMYLEWENVFIENLKSWQTSNLEIKIDEKSLL